MMKKVCAATLAALGCGATLAANVELFGAVDSYIAVNRTGGKYATALSSGGVDATHVGIRGTENLANGVQVYFQADAAVQSDNGAFSEGSGADGLFNRQVELGIRGSFGQLSFGRLYTPHFLTFLFYDPTGLSDASSYSGYFMAGPASTCGTNGELVRHSNSISYVLPTSFGLTNFLFMSLGEKDSKTTGSSTAGNIYNYAAKYDNGPFSAMASFLWEHDMRQTFGSPVKFDDKYFNFSVSYDLGVTKPVFQFMKKWVSGISASDHATGRVSSDLWLVQVGTSTPLWGGLFMTSATYLKNQTYKNADSYAFGMKYNYPLSKRTRVYTGFQAIKNEKQAAYQVEAGPDSSFHFNRSNTDLFGMGNGYGASAIGKNTQQFFVGLCHQF